MPTDATTAESAAAVVEVTDATFEELVLRSEQPVLLEFWAVWCPPCRQLAPVLDALAAEWAGRITVAKIDTDANPAVTAASGVLANPTLHLYRNGEPVASLVGARSQSRLRREVEDALTR